VSGLLVKLPVKEGQRVVKDEMIAQLRQDEFRAQLKILQSRLDQAQADLGVLRACATTG
jgi:multidrug efflux pump subunit AcrA (membrane-fusion protein)